MQVSEVCNIECRADEWVMYIVKGSGVSNVQSAGVRSG